MKKDGPEQYRYAQKYNQNIKKKLQVTFAKICVSARAELHLKFSDQLIKGVKNFFLQNGHVVHQNVRLFA
jgi:hypothetical protein